MHPEQLDDAKHVGPAADVFALGAILYECLAGAPAFPGRGDLARLARLAKGDRTPLRELCPDVPAWLDAVIERALAFDAPSRYADGLAALRALEAPRARSRASLAAAAALL